MVETSMGTDPYSTAGVDVAQADALVEWLQQKETEEQPRAGVVAGIGGFAAMYAASFTGMQEPLLVTTTDGVGTKLLLALEADNLAGIGLDLVAMNVNDLYTTGARPLFFLDYFACGKLDPAQFKIVLSGIRTGLQQCGAVLLGGETAEMPGLYATKHFDLAGFTVGVVDRSKALGPNRVLAGDLLFGLDSTGFHSNGFSLIRRWLGDNQPTAELLEQLLTPTKIYHEIPKLCEHIGPDLHALAHITGGGISGNLVRVVPPELACHVYWDELPTPSWMRDFIEQRSSLQKCEGVFNLGVGMIACVHKTALKAFKNACKEFGLSTTCIGEVSPCAADGRRIVYH